MTEIQYEDSYDKLIEELSALRTHCPQLENDGKYYNCSDCKVKRKCEISAIMLRVAYLEYQ